MTRSCLFPVLLAATFAALLAPPGVSGQFLKIEGVDGESRSSEHREWIDLLSTSWGPERSPTPSARTVGPLAITKRVDRTSPFLREAAANRRMIPEVTVSIRNPDPAARAAYLHVKLQNVIVSSYQTGRGDGGTESISFTFQRIEWE
jgi:type VI secretion system secreted protein Hcp